MLRMEVYLFFSTVSFPFLPDAFGIGLMCCGKMIACVKLFQLRYDDLQQIRLELLHKIDVIKNILVKRNYLVKIIGTNFFWSDR